MILQAEETENIQPVVDGDNHHILPRSHIIARPPAPTARPRCKATAMQPDHHGTFAVSRWGPDIQRQAILTIGNGMILDTTMEITVGGLRGIIGEGGIEEGKRNLAGLVRSLFR